MLEGGRAVKPFQFGESIYLGDPVNIARILTDYDAEEIIVVDRRCRTPEFNLLHQIFGETLMPVTYGGGIRSNEVALDVVKSGAEKVILKSALKDVEVLADIAGSLGSSAVAAAIDYRRSGENFNVAGFGPEISAGKFSDLLLQLEASGVGEVVLTNCDREGTGCGLDLEVVELTRRLATPVLIQGGAGSADDFEKAEEAGFDGVVFSSLFCLSQGSHEFVAGLPKVIVSDPTRFTRTTESEVNAI